MSKASIVLPRPGTVKPGDAVRAVKAPSEAAFVSTFGQLLPPASYLQTPKGTAAYYKIQATSPTPTDSKKLIKRVLFVHGIQTPSIGLQPLASALSSLFPHAQCVLVDLWGHGLTDTPIVPHEPALFHELLEGVMAHLRWEDAHFIGYSFGASTVASFAAIRPQRVSSMVLVAPAGLIRSTNFGPQKTYLDGGEGLEEQAQAWILDFLEGGPLTVPLDWKDRVKRGEVVAEAVRDWQMKEHEGYLASVVGVFRDGGALDRHAAFAEAATKSIKTLCILGELDDLSSTSDLQDVGMNNIAVVSQVGHGVVRQKVPEVTRLIEGFWNEL
jgi:pimeloyl-ACP methyl ester carboxylesterase